MACGTSTEPSGSGTPKSDTVADSAGPSDAPVKGDTKSSLCAPCKANADCTAAGDDTAACVDGGASGSFCGAGCGDDTPCAEGYDCADGKDVDGKDVKQCVPKAGTCTCSAWAIDQGATSACWLEKDGKKCAGKVVCNADGSLAACDAKAPAAETCDGVDNDCDGEADNGALCDDGQACTKDNCDKGAGKCVNDPDDKLCDDQEPCTTDACTAKGCTNEAKEGACDDGSICTEGDACKAGKCTAAKTKDCDDGDECTTDSCDPTSGVCKYADVPGCGLPADQSCKGKCTKYNAAWKCQCDSACKQYKDCCADIDKVCAPKCTSDTQCNDNNKCTTDSCNLNTGKCEFKAVADDSPCDDGQICTTEKCTAGQCLVKPLADGSKCEDGNPCTEESCINGLCSKKSKNCDDKDTCTTDSCDPADGTCKNVQKPTGNLCSDGESCTNSDKCTAAGQCVGTAKVDGVSCNDGKSCTTKDRCQTGKCIGTPDDKPCDDKNSCTTDQCSAASTASTGCLHTPIKDDTQCQDGDVCTVSDVCKSGACIGVMKCSAMFTETFDCGNKGGWTLSAPTGAVGWAVDDTPNPPGFYSKACSLNYNDGKSYPGATKGTATSKKFKLPASGAVSLRFQTWDEVEGSNSYDRRYVEISANGFTGDTHTVQLPNNMKKQQWAQFKTSTDKFVGKDVQVRLRFDSIDSVSNAGRGWYVDDLAVVVEKLPADLTCTVNHDCPFDGDPCTSQSCKDGKCVGGIANNPCEDGDLCTSKDTCKDGKCGAGPATDCDDANDCTDDSCDKVKGCQHKNNTGGCEDGDACTAPDECFGGACTAVPNTCHDNNPCTADSCDAGTGKCKNTKIAACEQKAVKVPWETKFDCATPKAQGWDPDVVGAGPSWAIDASPLPPAYKSPKCSLNFNDGKNIGCPDGKMLSKKKGVEGTAYSPYIDATGVAKGAWLAARFQLAGNWSGSAGHLDVEASDDNGKTWTKLQSLKSGIKTDWQVVTLDLAAWATKFFQLRFHFWTSNCSTSYSGPFIDDFKVWDATCKADADCDDTNGCTIDTCDVATGKCAHANAKIKTACDDGNACTSDEICNSTGKCGSGNLKVCNDDNGCTTDACDPGSGDCVYDNKAVDTACSDGNTCTDTDKCDDKGSCVGIASADGKSCSDANACTSADKCDGKGLCVGTAVAAGAGSCSDGNDCTDSDKCDGQGVCVGQNKNKGAVCTDSDPCTKDTCDGQGKCEGAADTAKCDDKDPCTLDTCIKKSTFSSTCKHAPTPDGAKCDDASPCTDGDTCTAGLCKGKAICNYKTLLTDKFTCGSKDWTLEPAGGAGKVGWQIDGLPTPPGFKSEKCSLNYNDDKSYNAKDAKNSGKATSKAVTIPANALDAHLKVWSYHGVEASSSYDKRYIEVSDDEFAKNVTTTQLDNTKGAKTWTLETISMTPWVGKQVKIRFRFDTVDGVNNATPGWFVDDLLVEAGTKK